jgi:hypothetical protein
MMAEHLRFSNSRYCTEGKAGNMANTKDGINSNSPAAKQTKPLPPPRESNMETMNDPSRAFADKLAKRSPPNPVERAEIERARKRTKARAPRIAMHIEDRGKAGSVVYPAHSDDEGHDYRLADAFGTRSLQFVYSMLKGLGNATEDHSLDYDFTPRRANQVALNAALAVISGVRPKDEIEAMLAAVEGLSNSAFAPRATCVMSAHEGACAPKRG